MLPEVVSISVEVLSELDAQRGKKPSEKDDDEEEGVGTSAEGVGSDRFRECCTFEFWACDRACACARTGMVGADPMRLRNWGVCMGMPPNEDDGDIACPWKSPSQVCISCC